MLAVESAIAMGWKYVTNAHCIYADFCLNTIRTFAGDLKFIHLCVFNLNWNHSKNWYVTYFYMGICNRNALNRIYW